MKINKSTADDLFIMQSIGPGKCRLDVNLTPYINAINNNEDTSEVFKQYSDEIGQGVGSMLMEQFIQNTLKDLPELEAKINTSDMMHILKVNGHEIIKNTLDECLFSCLKDPSHSPVASIEMNILEDKDMVQVLFTDNGKGFPITFLEQFKNENNIFQYLTEAGSHRKQSQAEDLREFKNQLSSNDSFEDLTTVEDNFSQRSISPFSDTMSHESSPRGLELSKIQGFGGRGLGLRNLVANVITGYPIQDIIHYNKILPELSLSSLKQNHSSIELFNSPLGANIQVKLPLEPRKIENIHKLINANLKLSTSNDNNNTEEELNKSILDKISFKRSKPGIK